jgi:chain length determinant protein EpsF
MLSFGQFLAIVRGRRWTIAFLWAGLVALVMAMTFLVPKQYTATAAVLVDVRAPELFNSQSALNPSWVPGYVATQVDVLRSERVALRAIRELGLEQDEAWRQRWHDQIEGRGDFASWIADEIHKKLDVKPSREGSAIHIAYTAKTPKASADVVNAIVRGYIDTARELRVEPAREFTAFFEERTAKLRKELEAAQARLSDYQRSAGILARDEHVDVETTRLNELNSQLVIAQVLAAEASSRRALAATDPSRSPEVLSNQVVSGLMADLSRQQARLEELNSRLGDRHPQVIESRANIDALRSRIANVTSQVSGSVAAGDSVSRGRVAQLEAALAAQRAMIFKMKGQRGEIEVLVRDVENAQRAYDLVLARGSQTSLESQNLQTNVSLLKSATEPVTPSSPLIWLNLGIALVAGLIVAIGYAVVRELMDRRLRAVSDAAEELQLMVLGELVDMSGPVPRTHSGQLLLAQPAAGL